ncbi:MAG: type II secretion system F family protein [Gemmatimonadaceae bacterium]
MSHAWRYRAANTAGELVDGIVRAESERAALDELRRQTLVPVVIEATRESASARRRPRSSRADALAASIRTAAALLGGGAPLDRTLEFAARHAEHPDVAEALIGVRSDVQGGQTLASALRSKAEVFGALAPSIVRAGEESGSLDAALSRLADHLERARDLRSQLRSALLYPALLAVVAGSGVLVLLAFVVPRFVAILTETGGALPITTRLLVGASQAMARYWWLWAAIILIAVGSARTWLRDASHRARWHGARLSWPLVGRLEAATWTARFCQALGALLQSGAPLLTSLRIARDGVENVALGARIETAIARVERGDRLAAAFEGVFPPLATQMLAVGEESGSLDTMASRVADTYDADVQRGLKTAVALVEPLLIMLFGGLVGFVALAMLQAIYSINASVL